MRSSTEDELELEEVILTRCWQLSLISETINQISEIRVLRIAPRTLNNISAVEVNLMF